MKHSPAAGSAEYYNLAEKIQAEKAAIQNPCGSSSSRTDICMAAFSVFLQKQPVQPVYSFPFRNTFTTFRS